MTRIELKCGVCGKEEFFEGDTDKLTNFKAYYWGWRIGGKQTLCPHHADLYERRLAKKALAKRQA